ncbi:MAG: TonB-dependent receptor, partial [Helicobacter sp.]|nr:TonB-dependent receptor [Helicobacter sp.]
MNNVYGTRTNVWNWPNYDKITAYILGNSRLSEMISLNSKLYYDTFDNKLQVIGAWDGRSIMATNWAGAAINPSRPYTSHYDDYALGGIFTLGFDFDKTKNLKVGVNLKQDNHKETATSWTSSNQYRNEREEISDLSSSLFAEYAQVLSDTLRVVVNGSYDRNDFISAQTDKDTSLRHLQGWTLQGILYADVNNYTTLYGNIGKKSKLPTIKDRFGSTWGRRVSNPDITPESAINYEVGSLFEWKAGKGSVAVFYNDINNMLISVGMPNNTCSAGTNCTRLENAKEGYAYGFEAGVQQGFYDETIVLGANYAYVQKKATNSNGSSYGVDGSRILDYPNHIVNASVLLAPIKQVDVIGQATFQSKQWYTTGSGANISYAQNKDVFLVDAKVNYRPIQSWQLSLGAYNLLDKNYYYGSGYYMAGRRIMASAEYRF